MKTAHGTIGISDIDEARLTWEGGDLNNQPVVYSDIHELMHRDISIGNKYRIERVKHMITVAAGVFALTVTFHKDLFKEHLTQSGALFLCVGWALLVISLLWGALHLRAWEDFYLNYREMTLAIWRRMIAANSAGAVAAVNAYNESHEEYERLKKDFRGKGWVQEFTLGLGLAFIAAYVGTGLYSRINSNDGPSETKPAIVAPAH